MTQKFKTKDDKISCNTKSKKVKNYGNRTLEDKSIDNSDSLKNEREYSQALEEQFKQNY